MIVNRFPFVGAAKLPQVITSISNYTGTGYATGSINNIDCFALQTATRISFLMICDVNSTSQVPMVSFADGETEYYCYIYSQSDSNLRLNKYGLSETEGTDSQYFNASNVGTLRTCSFWLAEDATYAKSNIREVIVSSYRSASGSTTTNSVASKYAYPDSSGETADTFPQGTSVTKRGTNGNYTLVRTGSSSANYEYTWVLSSTLN